MTNKYSCKACACDRGPKTVPPGSRQKKDNIETIIIILLFIIGITYGLLKT